MIRIKVPATTANMGPGFDSFGMALNLYDIFEIEETNRETIIMDRGKKVDEDYRENLIYNSLVSTLKRFDYKYEGFIINVARCEIPICRGLGSSAACIIGGVSAANGLMRGILTKEEVMLLATEIEGHPDNIVPAMVGGMVVSMLDNRKVNYSKVSVPNGLKFAAMIPEFQVSTSASREILPKAYEKEDCIFNICRSAMLVSALNNGEVDKLRACFGDRIHQPYRSELIPNSRDIFNKAKEFGSIGEFISGSGSTLMAVVKENIDNFQKSMGEYLKQLEGSWRIVVLEPDLEGVTVL